MASKLSLLGVGVVWLGLISLGVRDSQGNRAEAPAQQQSVLLSACAPAVYSQPTRVPLLPDWLVIYNNPFLQTLLGPEPSFLSSNTSCFRPISNHTPSSNSSSSPSDSSSGSSMLSDSPPFSQALLSLLYGPNRSLATASLRSCV